MGLFDADFSLTGAFDFGGPSGSTENKSMLDGFNFGPYETLQFAVPGAPEGMVASQNRADTEWAWFDQSKLAATFGDVLNAGIGAAKAALNQEISGRNQQTGQSFFDVLKNSALDRFSSSKTGRDIRSEVLASQVRTAFQNPIMLVAMGLGLVLIVALMRR